MLAYVFWHWCRTHVSHDVYEDKLVRFHEALREQNPAGFHCSLVFQTNQVPWLQADSGVYEEWYLLDGSAALDPLNEDAVSGLCLVPHQEVAKDSLDGVGGLYRLRRGDPNLSGVQTEDWFSKPEGVTYRDLDKLLLPFTEGDGRSLWGRQMALGPAPEFCLFGTAIRQLPEPLRGLRVQPRLVWSGDG